MEWGLTRRAFLAAAGTGVVGTARARASVPRDGVRGESRNGREQSAAVDVRGAVYLPTRAFNTYQLWANYDESVIERDMAYAARVNLNSVRTWLSYEFWLNDRRTLERRIDHFLETARKNGIRVLLGLFEAVGVDPHRSRRQITHPWYAMALRTPSLALMRRRTQWDGPRWFVEWFMDRYRDDERLLAIELMNEPGWRTATRRFSRSMFETLLEERGAIPLTIGSTSLANNAEYTNWGCDVLQYHYNNPRSPAICEAAIREGVLVADAIDRPIWLTEWQRVGSYEWNGTISGDQWQPNYSSMASTIHDAGVGNFFWSLMVKPAYRRGMRRQGLLNGLFHEDGAVWSRDDARAIKAMSGEPGIDVEERQEWPEWAIGVKERALGDRS